MFEGLATKGSDVTTRFRAQALINPFPCDRLFVSDPQHHLQVTKPESPNHCCRPGYFYDNEKSRQPHSEQGIRTIKKDTTLRNQHGGR